MTDNLGKSMSLRILKCRSSETRWSALATMAQSAYLLSSSSLCINPHSKNVDCNKQFSNDRINLRTLSATSGDVFSAIFSWYSSKISLLTTRSKSPSLIKNWTISGFNGKRNQQNICIEHNPHLEVLLRICSDFQDSTVCSLQSFASHSRSISESIFRAK